MIWVVFEYYNSVATTAIFNSFFKVEKCTSKSIVLSWFYIRSSWAFLPFFLILFAILIQKYYNILTKRRKKAVVPERHLRCGITALCTRAFFSRGAYQVHFLLEESFCLNSEAAAPLLKLKEDFLECESSAECCLDWRFRSSSSYAGILSAKTKEIYSF